MSYDYARHHGHRHVNNKRPKSFWALASDDSQEYSKQKCYRVAQQKANRYGRPVEVYKMGPENCTWIMEVMERDTVYPA